MTAQPKPQNFCDKGPLSALTALIREGATEQDLAEQRVAAGGPHPGNF